MRVVLEVDKCIGSGSCEMNAPEVFEVGEDGLAKLLNAAPGSEMEAECRMAEALGAGGRRFKSCLPDHYKPLEMGVIRRTAYLSGSLFCCK